MVNQQDERLYYLLDKAEKLVAEFSGGYSDSFSSAEEFYSSLTRSIAKLKAGNIAEAGKLYVWFSASYDWDDFTGKEGEKLGNEIVSLLYQLVKRPSVLT